MHFIILVAAIGLGRVAPGYSLLYIIYNVLGFPAQSRDVMKLPRRVGVETQFWGFGPQNGDELG